MTDKSSITMLLAGDDLPIREKFRNFLEDYEYEIIEADSVNVAIKLFEQKNPDLVLLDFNIHKANSLDLLSKIKARLSFPGEGHISICS